MKHMYAFCGMAACGMALFSACSTGTEGLRGRVMLEGASPIPGGHCESSAIMNALRYEGYDVTECMIVGGGGAPAFSFQKGLFPFIGARSLEMRERFFDAAGIVWYKEIPEVRDPGWKEISGLLSRGVPVVLRVDMRFLPYKYGGKYGSAHMSFGWHMITLFGIDWDRGLAFVSDTAFTGLQTIKISDLSKARFSSTKNLPPRGEYYWAEPKPDGYRINADTLVRASFSTIVANYESGALEGLSGFGNDLANLETYSPKVFLMPAVLEYMAGTIEDYGTGGAAFRILLRNFLVYASVECPASGADRLIPLADGAIESWHALSREQRALSPAIKGMDASCRAAAFSRLGKSADELFIQEKALYTEMKKISEGD